MPTKTNSGSSMVIDAEYVQALKTYYTKRVQDKFFGGVSDSEKHAFIDEVNSTLHDLGVKTQPNQHYPLTEPILTEMLEGRIGPTPELLKAFHLVFNIYGDERDAFLEKGNRAVQNEAARFRHVTWLATEEGQAEKAKTTARRQESAHRGAVSRESDLQDRTAKQLAEARMEANRQRWRARNPAGMQNRLSFQEMLEISHANGDDFKAFLFDNVMPAWAEDGQKEMSQVKFSAHLAKLNRDRDDIAKPTLTDTVLSNWRAGKAKPLRDSVDVICCAFGIEPDEGELMALHQKMLWRTINGYPFTWGNKKGVRAIDAAIADTKASGDSGPLVTELIDSSGIRFERLKEALQIQQIPQWKKGARIASLDKAVQFLSLVNPQPTEEINADPEMGITRTISRQNREILSLVTGREFDIEKILADAAGKGYPGGALFTALIGDRNGMVEMNSGEMIAQIKANGIECTDDRLKKMRTGTQLQRGGKIHEAEAEIIMQMVEDRMQHLIELGICKKLTNDQKQRCIDMLTGQPHPKKMLQAALSGAMSAGDIISRTCERRGLNMSTGEDSFCQQVGISHASHFVTGKANLQHGTAAKIARWFQDRYKFTPTEKRQFIALATGHDLNFNADGILEEVMSGELGRIEGLRQIYDRPNIPREALARKAKVPHHTIQYSVTETSGGRIVADKEAIERIGRTCGISEYRLKDFVSIYDGHAVGRQVEIYSKQGTWAKTTNGRPRSGEPHQGRVS